MGKQEQFALLSRVVVLFANISTIFLGFVFTAHAIQTRNSLLFRLSLYFNLLSSVLVVVGGYGAAITEWHAVVINCGTKLVLQCHIGLNEQVRCDIQHMGY
jgi:hypothetical protein